jgi:hypothetical protein
MEMLYDVSKKDLIKLLGHGCEKFLTLLGEGTE